MDSTRTVATQTDVSYLEQIEDRDLMICILTSRVASEQYVSELLQATNKMRDGEIAELRSRVVELTKQLEQKLSNVTF